MGKRKLSESQRDGGEELSRKKSRRVSKEALRERKDDVQNKKKGLSAEMTKKGIRREWEARQAKGLDQEKSYRQFLKEHLSLTEEGNNRRPDKYENASKKEKKALDPERYREEKRKKREKAEVLKNEKQSLKAAVSGSTKLQGEEEADAAVDQPAFVVDTVGDKKLRGPPNNRDKEDGEEPKFSIKRLRKLQREEKKGHARYMPMSSEGYLAQFPEERKKHKSGRKEGTVAQGDAQEQKSEFEQPTNKEFDRPVEARLESEGPSEIGNATKVDSTGPDISNAEVVHSKKKRRKKRKGDEPSEQDRGTASEAKLDSEATTQYGKISMARRETLVPPDQTDVMERRKTRDIANRELWSPEKEIEIDPMGGNRNQMWQKMRALQRQNHFQEPPLGSSPWNTSDITGGRMVNVDPLFSPDEK